MPEAAMKFHYSISVEFEFSGEDLAMLFECSRHHYDGLCKAASHAGSLGFLWGYINGMQMARSSNDLKEGRKYTPIENPDKAIKLPGFAALKNMEVLDSRHLDTMAKILEQAHLHEFRLKAAELAARIHNAFMSIRTEYERMNPRPPKKGTTLKDVMPAEFMSGEYVNTPARQFADCKVLAKHETHVTSWPGKHRHVSFWCVLEGGVAVGFNENPSHGWSFPVKAWPRTRIAMNG